MAVAVRPAQARATLVLLHGRAHEAATMHDLADRLGFDDVACVAPAAPDDVWYPGRFFDPRAGNEPELGAATARVHGILDELVTGGVPPERIVLGGFSQGACLAADLLTRRPRRIGALAVLCGGMIGTESELAAPAPGSLDGLPVLITATEDDDWVPVARVRDTAARLRAAGAAVDLRVYDPAPHGLRDDEVDALRALVRGLGPPPAIS